MDRAMELSWGIHREPRDWYVFSIESMEWNSYLICWMQVRMIYKELFFCFIKGCEWSCECHHAARYLPQPNSYFILWIFHSSSCDAACKFISSLAIFSWQLKASLLKSTKNSLFLIFQGIFLIGKDILRITEVMFDFVWESNMTLQKLKTWWWFLNKQQQNLVVAGGQ